MKKTISMVLLLSLCCALCLCSCGQKSYPMAESFNSPQIENSFNNNLAGARMAYANDTLYCSYYTNEVWFRGVYAINNNGCNVLIPGSKTISASDMFCNPLLFQYKNDLLLLDGFTNEYSVLDDNKEKLVTSDFDLNFWSTSVYLSDDLIIRFPGNSSKLSVKKSGEDEFDLYGITGHPVAFYPCDNTVYVMNDSGWLYRTDINKDNGKCEYISELEEIRCKYFLECGGYLYIDCYENGMYRYSIENGATEFIYQEKIDSMNSYEDMVYYSTKGGVFSCDTSGEINKLCNLRAEEIYIFDTEWIYLYNMCGEIYRVSQNGDTVERIIRFDSKAQSGTSEK